MIADIEVKAETLEEAIQKASKINAQEQLPEGKYVLHSFEVQRNFINQDEE